MGVEVDDHPAFGSYWDDAFAKLFALPNLRHWHGSLKGGTITIDVLVSSFLSSNVPNVSTGTSSGVWFQIYQAECRCRSECMCDLAGLLLPLSEPTMGFG